MSETSRTAAAVPDVSIGLRGRGSRKYHEKYLASRKKYGIVSGDVQDIRMAVLDEIMQRLVAALPRELHIDLIDMSVARALQAHEIVRDNTDLTGKSARGLEGQARFRLMEKGFQDACELHGGRAIAGGLLPGTDLRFYQPFIRFAGEREGVVLGLASMPMRRELPQKNQSRLTGVSLNCALTPRLALDPSDPQPGDLFALFLVARDPARAGKIDEMAIGVIDARYKTYLFYQPIETFIAHYVLPAPPPADPETTPPARLVKLKPGRRGFRPPEAPDADESSSDGTA